MINYNTKEFFTRYVIEFGRFNEQQKDGLKFLLTKISESKRLPLVEMKAYVLATVKFETAGTFQPVTEYGSQSYLKAKPYYPYIGRGFCQLTWRSNYLKFGKVLGIDLIENLDLAKEPETAWKIMEMGMTDNFGIQDPDFTGFTLEDFFNKGKIDFENARKIVNPKDYKTYKPIARIAEAFQRCLKVSEIEQANEAAVPLSVSDVLNDKI